jgi:dipeptidyl-peptidase-4
MAGELGEEVGGFARALLVAAGDASCAAQPSSSVTPPHAISVEDVVQQPLPGFSAPVAWAFSPDDAVVSCLWSAEGTLTRQLYAFDCAMRSCASLLSGSVDEGSLSHEEKLRRERARERGLGVTAYAWAKRARNRLLVNDPRAGLLLQDGAGAPAVCAVRGGDVPMLDAQLSPDGGAVAFVRGGDVFVASACADATPRQLTFRGDAPASVTHGLADYIAQEEMQRAHGYWWSPDGGAIAFCRVDDAPCARYRIPHWTADPSAEELHAFPFAGTANARVQLGVVRLTDGAVVWCDVDCGGCSAAARPEEEYLARVAWSADGSEVWAQLQDRAQRTLSVVAFDAATGARTRVLLTERGHPWVNLSDAWRPLADGCMLWSSERTGHRHLYLVDCRDRAAQATVTPITAGAWAVDALEGVDEASGTVYFTATAESALERHLYAAALRCDAAELSPPRKLTHAPGMHSVTLDHAFARFIDVHDAPDSPPRVTLRALADGAELLRVWEPAAPPPRVARLGLTPPELFTVAAEDGTPLHAALFRPAGAGPWPLVVSVYGGPHVQTVTRSWAMTVDMRAQALRSRGFTVLKLDSRGSSRRGLAFESTLHLRMGSTELADQAAGVAALVASGVADAARVGIYGWSYGGYLAALAALRMPATFRAAVAGAPVTSWDGACMLCWLLVVARPRNTSCLQARPARARLRHALHGALHGPAGARGGGVRGRIRAAPARAGRAAAVADAAHPRHAGRKCTLQAHRAPHLRAHAAPRAARADALPRGAPPAARAGGACAHGAPRARVPRARAGRRVRRQARRCRATLLFACRVRACVCARFLRLCLSMACC